MSFAFEVTPDDLAVIIRNKGRVASEEEVLELFGEVDTDTVAEAALYYDDIDAQTKAAYEEMEMQLHQKLFSLPKA